MIEIIKKNWLLVVIVIGVVIFIFITNGTDFADADDDEAIVTPLSTEENNDLKEDKDNSSVIIIDVKGEVANPGIYEVESNARVNDVIQLAGGFTKEANETHVNLAQIVQDEMVIMVPGMNDDVVSVDSGMTGENKVRINYATQEEIETLSGIGPSKAQTIIEYREEHGLFKNVDDLLEISGIGEKTLENIRDDIEVP